MATMPKRATAKTAYPGVTWIAEGDYEDMDTLEGVACRRFHRAAGLPGTKGEGIPEMAAWIAAAGNAPLRARLGGVLYLYSPSEPWEQTVRLPPEVRAKIDEAARQDRALDALRRLGVRPSP